jgi:hypothetical protein
MFSTQQQHLAQLIRLPLLLLLQGPVFLIESWASAVPCGVWRQRVVIIWRNCHNCTIVTAAAAAGTYLPTYELGRRCTFWCLA